MQVYWGFGEFGCRLYRATFELEEFRATPSAPRKKRTRKKMKTVVIRKDAPQTISTSWSSSTRWRPCPPAAITTRTRRSPACRPQRMGHNQGDATCRTMEPAPGTISFSSDTSDHSMQLSTEVDNKDIMDLFTINMKAQRIHGRAASVVSSREQARQQSEDRNKSCPVQTEVKFGSSFERIIADGDRLHSSTKTEARAFQIVHSG